MNEENSLEVSELLRRAKSLKLSFPAVKQDFLKALELYKQTVDLGEKSAYLKVAEMFAEGRYT